MDFDKGRYILGRGKSVNTGRQGERHGAWLWTVGVTEFFIEQGKWKSILIIVTVVIKIQRDNTDQLKQEMFTLSVLGQLQ